MSVPSLGDRLRQARVQRGIGLRALARDVGLSASMISQLETGKSRPSVSTLYAIANALGISMQEVFADTPQDLAPAPSAAVSTMMQTLTATSGVRLGPLVHPAQRQVLTLDSGVTWERLGRIPPLEVDFLLATYIPGGCSSSTGELMHHPGWEYGYLVSGELVLTLGGEDMIIRPGDAVSFDSMTPHRYRNDHTEPAVGVWFVIETRP